VRGDFGDFEGLWLFYWSKKQRNMNRSDAFALCAFALSHFRTFALLQPIVFKSDRLPALPIKVTKMEQITWRQSKHAPPLHGDPANR
jgi:hypothetical protein